MEERRRVAAAHSAVDDVVVAVARENLLALGISTTGLLDSGGNSGL